MWVLFYSGCFTVTLVGMVAGLRVKAQVGFFSRKAQAPENVKGSDPVRPFRNQSTYRYEVI